MLSRQFVSRRSKNFTSNVSVRMPPPVSVDHSLRSRKPARRDARATGARGPAARARKRPGGRFRAPAKGGDARDRGLVPLFHATINVSARRRHSVKSTAQQDWSRRPPSSDPDGRATRGRAARRKHETRVRLPTIRPADVPVTNTPRRPTSATTAAPTGRVVPRRDRPRHAGPPGWSGTAQTQIRLRAF
ncbi:hypothetical protein AGLY_017761 [Aphis glycines]|uniref:Uncharacterized protein n=1 Tax=Aphis glycines TaxID=307491 RepID=A0A6G0SU97_APHGL|nr:hypothetical protein AGLY_017761 [Aphis glycines]